MKVVGLLEQRIVFGIQIPEKEVGIYCIFLGIKQRLFTKWISYQINFFIIFIPNYK